MSNSGIGNTAGAKMDDSELADLFEKAMNDLVDSGNKIGEHSEAPFDGPFIMNRLIGSFRDVVHGVIYTDFIEAHEGIVAMAKTVGALQELSVKNQDTKKATLH